MRKFLPGILLAVSMLYTRPASAVGPSAALLFGNGFKDGYNVGFGARGGLTLPMSLYVGATFIYHLGHTVPSIIGDASANLFYLGPEGGFDVSAGPLTLRPYLGLGYASLRYTAPQTCSFGVCAGGSASEGKVAVWPGVAALFPIGSAFVGADLRYVIVIDAEDGSAFSAFATGGMNF